MVDGFEWSGSKLITPDGFVGPDLRGPRGFPGAPGPAAPVDSMLAVVRHGSNAAEARPSGFGAVYWIGSVAPSNAVDGDFWRES